MTVGRRLQIPLLWYTLYPIWYVSLEGAGNDERVDH